MMVNYELVEYKTAILLDRKKLGLRLHFSFYLWIAVLLLFIVRSGTAWWKMWPLTTVPFRAALANWGYSNRWGPTQRLARHPREPHDPFDVSVTILYRSDWPTRGGTQRQKILIRFARNAWKETRTLDLCILPVCLVRACAGHNR